MNYQSNPLNYSTPEQRVAYQKYKLNHYEPYSISNLPNFASTSQNLLLRTQEVNSNYKNKPREFTVEPIGKKPMEFRLKKREEIEYKSDKVFDIIELNSLIATNDLVQLRLGQEKLGKSDFSYEFSIFPKKLHSTIKKTGDKILDITNKINEEFEMVKSNINYDLSRILKSNKRPGNKLHKEFSEFKERIENKIAKTDDLISSYASKVHDLVNYLTLKSVELPPELRYENIHTINWQKRLENKRKIKLLELKSHKQKQLLNSLQLDDNDFKTDVLKEKTKATNNKILYERIHNDYYKAALEFSRILQKEKMEKQNEYDELLHPVPTEIEEKNCIDFQNLLEQKVAFENKRLIEERRKLEDEKLKLIQSRREEEEKFGQHLVEEYKKNKQKNDKYLIDKQKSLDEQQNKIMEKEKELKERERVLADRELTLKQLNNNHHSSNDNNSKEKKEKNELQNEQPKTSSSPILGFSNIQQAINDEEDDYYIPPVSQNKDQEKDKKQ